MNLKLKAALLTLGVILGFAGMVSIVYLFPVAVGMVSVVALFVLAISGIYDFIYIMIGGNDNES